MATTHVMYQGKRLIPAPLMSIQKAYDKDGAGNILGSRFDISVRGTLLAFMGSPTTSGTFWTLGGYPPDEIVAADSRLKAIQSKQQALRALFNVQGELFEVQSADGSSPMRFRPRINSVEFPEGLWYDSCDYTINMEADSIYFQGFLVDEDSFNSNIVSANENWEIQQDEQLQILTITHSVNAQGKGGWTTTGTPLTAWEEARKWVRTKLGFNADIARSTIFNYNTGNPIGYDLVKTESIGINEGTYSATESWKLSETNYIHTFDVTLQSDIQNGPTIASIQGNVQGLGTANYDAPLTFTTTKYAAASSAFYGTLQGQIYNNLLAYSHQSYLNPTPLNYNITESPKAGLINYNYTYDTRPTNCIPNSRFENISVVDNNPADVIAIIPIPGRTAGPIIQNIRTKTEKTRTVTIEVGMAVGSGNCLTKLNGGRPDYSTITGVFKPVASQVFIQQDQETWEPMTGRGSKVVTWIYQ